MTVTLFLFNFDEKRNLDRQPLSLYMNTNMAEDIHLAFPIRKRRMKRKASSGKYQKENKASKPNLTIERIENVQR